jgi:hypothetical protein
MLASLIETCKLHSVNPQAYLTDVLTKLVNNWPNSRLAELTPWAGLPHADPGGGGEQNRRVKGFRWRPRLIAYVHADRHRQAQQCRPAGLARRRLHAVSLRP